MCAAARSRGHPVNWQATPETPPNSRHSHPTRPFASARTDPELAPARSPMPPICSTSPTSPTQLASSDGHSIFPVLRVANFHPTCSRDLTKFLSTKIPALWYSALITIHGASSQYNITRRYLILCCESSRFKLVRRSYIYFALLYVFPNDCPGQRIFPTKHQSISNISNALLRTYELSFILHFHAPPKSSANLSAKNDGRKLDRVCHDPARRHFFLKGFHLHFAPDPSLVPSSFGKKLGFAQHFENSLTDLCSGRFTMLHHSRIPQSYSFNAVLDDFTYAFSVVHYFHVSIGENAWNIVKAKHKF